LSFRLYFLVALFASILLAGCAKPPENKSRLTVSVGQVKPGVLTSPKPVQSVNAAQSANAMPAGFWGAVGEENVTTASFATSGEAASQTHALRGRTLNVSDASDLRLRRKEVILTFDDGPAPRATSLILAALEKFGVKATFFMVGKMANAHPKTARAVAQAGHTIASHTHGHENLTGLGTVEARRTVAIGESEIARAIAPTGKKVAPFFRFPYLAQTRALRADLKDLGLVIFDVDIDSLDFKNDTPEIVLKRTLVRLEQEGRGIILLHDIHMRTARLLPELLRELEQRGYKVVHAVANHRALFDTPLQASLR